MKWRINKGVFRMAPTSYQLGVNIHLTSYPHIKDITLTMSLLTRICFISITWGREEK
jgi:hypothetical protein